MGVRDGREDFVTVEVLATFRERPTRYMRRVWRPGAYTLTRAEADRLSAAGAEMTEPPPKPAARPPVEAVVAETVPDVEDGDA